MADLLNIQISSDTKLLALTDIHEHPRHFSEMLNKFQIGGNNKLIVCGDIIDKGYGYNAFVEIASQLKDLIDDGHAYFLKGNHELKRVKKAKQANKLDFWLDWVDQQPISYSMVYPNKKRFTFLHGGVTKNATWDTLRNDINICYVRGLNPNGEYVASIKNKDGKFEPKQKDVVPWHEIYDGRFGFIVSGHEPLYDGKPKIYEYSANIDTACFLTKILTGLIITEDNIQTISVKI